MMMPMSSKMIMVKRVVLVESRSLLSTSTNSMLNTSDTLSFMLNISVNEAHIVTCIVNHAETGTEMLNILKNSRG